MYQEALQCEFENQLIPYVAQKKIEVFYNDKKLNKFFKADFVCFNKIIVELKAIKQINEATLSQPLNYLKATKMKLGLLINFGEKSLTWRRYINTY